MRPAEPLDMRTVLHSQPRWRGLAMLTVASYGLNFLLHPSHDKRKAVADSRWASGDLHSQVHACRVAILGFGMDEREHLATVAWLEADAKQSREWKAGATRRKNVGTVGHPQIMGSSALSRAPPDDGFKVLKELIFRK